ALKKKKGRGICVMGGGELASALFDADLVDEVGLNIHPIVLGAGIPMFPRIQKQIDLEMIRSQPLTGGCLYALYRITHGQ
ncbi:MAG TPA: dihydrofolate reductase family protein, partial [Vicinamibacterales bacterium]